MNLSVFFKRLRSDHRYLICLLISAACVGFGFLFPNAIPRLAETIRDLAVSVAYYVCEIFVPENNPVAATVVQMPTWRWAEDRWEPLRLFPWTWEEFKALWQAYWPAFFSRETLVSYTAVVGDVIYTFSRLSLCFVPMIMLLIMWLNGYKNKYCTDRHRKSKQLLSYEKFSKKILYPVVGWCKDFIAYCKAHSGFCWFWLFCWILYFNVATLGVAFFAYYLYFAASWDLPSLYPQLLKLMIDLAPPVRFLPAIVWSGLAIWLYNHICRSMAFQRLYAAEKANRAFLSQRGVVTCIYGEMGIGKTQMVTSMALSAEIEQFDMAFEILLEQDMKFPNFPWQSFRDQLKKRIENREIVDLPTCRDYVKRSRIFFDRISAMYTAEEYREKRQRYKLLKEDYTFGYDYSRYPTTYNDELKISHLYDALEDYACAYLIFTVKTSLLFSNYSIRVDSILKDVGNFPCRDNDFFKRDPRLQEAYSRHAHIIDVDMLRLGRKIVKGNPKARRLSFGVYVITEIDKEFKNQLQLKETKIKEDETNQKNDLHDACLMIMRHAAVVSNRVFIRLFADLQRPEAWGAGGRELGEVIYISEKSDLEPTLPVISPYWLCFGVFSWIKKKWNEFKAEHDHNRSDQTLFIHTVKNTIHNVNNHYDKVNGLFGCMTLTLQLQSGRMDGDVKTDKWRILTKKDRSRRYRTACLEAVFDSYEPNTMHVDDFIMYAGEVGTTEENMLQNSYFQMDIAKMKAMNQ